MGKRKERIEEGTNGEVDSKAKECQAAKNKKVDCEAEEYQVEEEEKSSRL